ncbi:hypothetical protein QUB70_17100 [Microcoleus sp. A003_D6]
MQKSFHQLMGRALGPIPEEKITLVGRALGPVLIIFARGLSNTIFRILNPVRLFSQPPTSLAASVSNANCFEFDRPFLLRMPIVRL